MRTKISLAVVILLIALGLIATVSKTNNQVEIHQLDLRTKEQQIDILNKQTEANELKLKEAQGDQKKLKQIEAENKKLQDEIEALQARKAEEARLAQAEVKNAVQASPQTVTGDWVAQCHAWAAEAGIVLTPSAIQLLERESHCSNTAQNPTSPACGIAQNINGCGSAGYGYDPISQLIWFHNYCQSRYGGFDGALAHSLAKGWY
jgi:TolA-binding protein